MGKAQKYFGKTKGEIAKEAFKLLGPDATQAQVDQYFQQNYKLEKCEISMYYTARGEAKRQRPKTFTLAPRPTSLENKVIVNPAAAQRAVDLCVKPALYGTATPATLVQRTKQLAQDVGGYEQLRQLLNALEN